MTIIKLQSDTILWWLSYKRRVIDKLERFSNWHVDVVAASSQKKDKKRVWQRSAQRQRQLENFLMDDNLIKKLEVNGALLKSRINKDY